MLSRFVICLGSVGVSILSFLIFVGSSLPFPGAVFFNHDGNDGTAPDPMVWSGGALSPRGDGSVHAARDRPCCLNHPLFGVLGWINVLASAISADDVAQLPYTNGLLVKWVSFLGSLHWPVGSGPWCWWYFLC